MSKPFYELLYGNTRTFLISNGANSILIDTDWAGTLLQFFKAIKSYGVKVSDIRYLILTHFHPDHMGLASELQSLGVQVLAFEEQRAFLHSSDAILVKSNQTYQPIADEQVLFLSCEDSREFFAQNGLDLEVIATPGHSEDSISVIYQGRYAFVGDLYTLVHA